MRLRIGDDRTTDGDPFRGYAKINGVIQFDHSVPYIASKIWRAMQDVETPRFKEKICQGQILNNRMLSQTYLEASRPAYLKTTGVISGYPAIQEYPVLLSPALLTDLSAGPELRFDAYAEEDRYNDVYLNQYASERSIAIAKAWSNVSKAEIQALASLGELPETVEWLKSIYTRAARVIKAVKARNVSRIVESLTVPSKPKKVKKKKLPKKALPSDKELKALPLIGNTWLEYRYALRPLIFEMQQAIAALQATIAKGTRFTSRGFHEKQDSTITTKRLNTGWVDLDRQLTITRSSNYRAGVLTMIEDDINSIMAIWGLDQLPETVYELTPFSFILDWFFNVGSIIGAWSPKASLTTLTSWIVEQHLISMRLRFGSVLPVDSPGVDWRTAEISNADEYYYRWDTTIKRRLTLPDRPILPTFNLRLDLAKVADLAAIGYALIKGSPNLKVAKRA